MQPKPPAAGVGKTAYLLAWAGELFIYYVWEKKDLHCFERIFEEYERGGKVMGTVLG